MVVIQTKQIQITCHSRSKKSSAGKRPPKPRKLLLGVLGRSGEDFRHKHVHDRTPYAA